jgi:hypothetical protein
MGVARMIAFPASVTAGSKLEATVSPFLLFRVPELGAVGKDEGCKMFFSMDLGDVLTSHALSSISTSFPGLTSNDGTLAESLAGSGTYRY